MLVFICICDSSLIFLFVFVCEQEPKQAAGGREARRRGMMIKRGEGLTFGGMYLEREKRKQERGKKKKRKEVSAHKGTNVFIL